MGTALQVRWSMLVGVLAAIAFVRLLALALGGSTEQEIEHLESLVGRSATDLEEKVTKRFFIFILRPSVSAAFLYSSHHVCSPNVQGASLPLKLDAFAGSSL
jgi:hypothetical protein